MEVGVRCRSIDIEVDGVHLYLKPAEIVGYLCDSLKGMNVIYIQGMTQVCSCFASHTFLKEKCRAVVAAHVMMLLLMNTV